MSLTASKDWRRNSASRSLFSLNSIAASKRGTKKRPQVSDLRDSGAIEEAADIVGLLYSEGYYDPNFSMPYVLECQIAKNRNGERGACLWRWSRECALTRVQLLDSGAAAQYRRISAKNINAPGATFDGGPRTSLPVQRLGATLQRKERRVLGS